MPHVHKFSKVFLNDEGKGRVAELKRILNMPKTATEEDVLITALSHMSRLARHIEQGYEVEAVKTTDQGGTHSIKYNFVHKDTKDK